MFGNAKVYPTCDSQMVANEILNDAENQESGKISTLLT